MSDSKSSIACPYLGILADPDTRVAEADLLNHCFCSDPPSSVDLEHQELYCSNENHSRCQIYVAYKSVEESSTPTNKIKSRLAALPLLFARKSTDDAGKQTEPDEVVVQESQEDIELPENNVPEWKKQLHEEAQNNYSDVSTTRKGKRAWVFVLGLALIALIVFVWASYNRFNNLMTQAQPSGNSGSSQVTLATPVINLGGVVNSYETAVSVLEIGAQAEATRNAATAIVQAAELQDTPQPEEELLAGSIVLACTDLDEIEYEIIEGPMLTPNEGYYYTTGSAAPEITASWLLENTGNCNWENISFLSLFDGQIITPLLKRDGEYLDLVTTGGRVLVSPGDQIEVVLDFDLTEARNVNEEYVVMINDISLVSQPHTIIQVEGWVIIIKPLPTEAPIKPTKERPPSVPPGRPTDSP